MSVPIVFRRVARNEFDEAADWYEHRRAGRGAKFSAAVRAVLNRIAEQPDAYSQVFEDVREALVTGYPYCVLPRRGRAGDCPGCFPHVEGSIHLAESGVNTEQALTLTELQHLIWDTYDAKDRRRGVEGTFMWFMEEVGELSAALRSGSEREQAEEFADVLAWLATLANVVEVDLEAAVQAKYGRGCPGCRQSPCVCNQADKP